MFNRYTDNQRRIVRFVLAITTGFTLAQLVSWQLSYIMPILLSMLMAGPAIDLKAGVLFFAVIVGGCLFGMLLSMTVVSYPLLCLLLFALLLMQIYIAGNKGLSPFAVIMLMMGLTVIPLIGIPSLNLSWLLVEALIQSGLIAVAVALLFFALIPTDDTAAPPKPTPEGPQLSPEISGVISTLVILPLLAYFYSYSVTNAIIVLVFAAILAQTVNLATTAKGAAALILANGMGGLFAVAIYNLLVAAPTWPFMSGLIALVATFFAARIFSDKPTAPLYSSAFTAVLLLVGSSLSSDSKDATEAMFSRLTQVFLAGAYVVIAFAILKRVSRFLRGETVKEKPSGETAIITDIGA